MPAFSASETGIRLGVGGPSRRARPPPSSPSTRSRSSRYAVCVCRIALGSPVVPDVHCTNAASGSHFREPSSRCKPSGRTSATASTAPTARSTSAAGARQLTGTKTASAIHTPNMVVTISGVFGNCTATGWPGPTPASRRAAAVDVAACRAAPAVTDRSIVCRSGSSSAQGCDTSSSDRRIVCCIQHRRNRVRQEARVPEGPSITDEGVARLRERIGIPQPHPQPPHYRCPNEDAFRQVADAYGDDNPLWCDPVYASGTRWRGPLAPPPLVGGDTLIGENEVAELDPAQTALLKGDPIRGAHAFYSGSFREWWAPLRPGTPVTRRNALVGVHDKRSEFAERAVHEWTAEVFAADTVLSAQYRLMIRTEREKAAGRGKYDETTIAPYTDDQLREIDDAYASEPARRRGAEPRWWEDVQEGHEIGRLVKGPLRVTDMVCWHVGMGM